MCSKPTDDEFAKILRALPDVTEHADELTDDVRKTLLEACDRFLDRARDKGEEPPQSAEEAWEDSLLVEDS